MKVGRRHHVAVGGEELAERAPHGMVAGEPVGEEDQRELSLRRPGVLPRALRRIEDPLADLGEGRLPGRIVRLGQGAAALQVDELRQHHLGRGADPPRQGTAFPEEEVEVVRAPPAGCGKVERGPASRPRAVSGGAGYHNWNTTVRVCPVASTRRSRARYSGRA